METVDLISPTREIVSRVRMSCMKCPACPADRLPVSVHLAQSLAITLLDPIGWVEGMKTKSMLAVGKVYSYLHYILVQLRIYLRTSGLM